MPRKPAGTSTTRRRSAKQPPSEPLDVGQLGELFAIVDGDPSATLYLYRVAPRTTNVTTGHAFLEKFVGWAPDVEHVRERYGGGTFRIIARGKDDTKTVTFSIEAPPKFQTGEVHADAGSAVPGVPQLPGAPVQADPIAALSAQVQQLTETVTHLVNGGGVQRQDENAEFRRMIREHLFLKQLTSATQEQTQAEPLGMVERLIEIYDRMRDGADADAAPSWMPAVEKIAEAVAAGAFAGPTAVPAVHQAQPAPVQEAPQVNPASQQEIALLNALAEAIESKQDPADFASYAKGMVPADVLASLVSADARSFVKMFWQYRQHFPAFGLVTGQKWLAQLHAAIVAELAPPDAGAGPGDEASGADAAEEEEESADGE